MPAPTLPRTWFEFTHPAERILPPPWYHYVDALDAAIRCERCRTIGLGPYRVLYRGRLLCPSCLERVKAREN